MPRVLVVEDDRAIAEIIADELSAGGHLVDVVGNGADALESVREFRPDVIVLDLMLPAVDGWQFVETYREVTNFEEIPIVVVSAAGAITRTMEMLGVRRFLRKPFNPSDVLEAVNEVT